MSYKEENIERDGPIRRGWNCCHGTALCNIPADDEGDAREHGIQFGLCSELYRQFHADVPFHLQDKADKETADQIRGKPSGKLCLAGGSAEHCFSCRV